MKEHYHSLKSETSHETNPLLYEVLTKPTLSKHRPQRQSEEAGERGKGEREMEGRGYSFEKVKHEDETFWQEKSFEPCESLSVVTQCQKFQYYFNSEHFCNRRLIPLIVQF